MTTIISAVYGVLLARIAVEYGKDDKENTRRVTLNTQKIQGAICTVPAVLIVVFGREFYQLWVPAEDAQYLQLLSLITCIPVIIHSTMWTVYGLNVTNNCIRTPALVLIMIGCVSVAFTVVLLRYTSFGALAIVGVSAALNSLFYLFFIPQYTARKMGYPTWTFVGHVARSLVFCGLLALLLQPVRTLLRGPLQTWIGFLAVAAVSELAGVALYLFVVCSRADRRVIADTVRALAGRRGAVR